MRDERSDRDTLIEAYFRNARVSPEDDTDWWAWQEVSEIVHNDPPDVAWDLLLAMIRQAPEDLVDDIAAGPLEDLVTRAGTELIDALETTARREPRVRQALGGIWVSWGAFPEDVMSRLIRASGDRINPLGEKPAGKRRRR